MKITSQQFLAFFLALSALGSAAVTTTGNLRANHADVDATAVEEDSTRILSESDVTIASPGSGDVNFNPHTESPTAAPLPRTNRPDGMECHRNSHCKTGSVCAWGQVCRPGLILGAVCDTSSKCLSGYCHPGLGVLKFCAQNFGEPCALDSDCRSDAHCTVNQATHLPSHCEPDLENGSSCWGNSECKSDYCNLVGTCKAKLGRGYACTTNHMCDSGKCQYKFPYFQCVD